jgi:hypothetical protein
MMKFFAFFAPLRFKTSGSLTSAIRAKALRYIGFGFWQPTTAYLLTF